MSTILALISLFPSKGVFLIHINILRLLLFLSLGRSIIFVFPDYFQMESTRLNNKPVSHYVVFVDWDDPNKVPQLLLG